MENTNKQNYADIFCESVDTIIQERLKGISFDSTILCTIINDSQKEQGIYVVSNGSTSFEAYSTVTDYEKNDNVYVQIPGSDWNQQKFIVAKKAVRDKEKTLTYKNPFSSLIDITGNLIQSNLGEQGLLANAENTEEDKSREEIILWSYIPDNSAYDSGAIESRKGPNLANYTRLGLQASFRSLLNPCIFDVYDSDNNLKSYQTEITNGNYGLKLKIWAWKETTIEEKENLDNENVENYYTEVFLDTESMNGNPYNFTTYYEQEIVVNISEYKGLRKLELVFFQNKKFKDNEGIYSPIKDIFGNDQPNNLFVKDCYLTLGYDVNEFDDEMALIFSENAETYTRAANPLYNNHKNIQLRWIHQIEDGSYKVITENDKDYHYKVVWYRYQLGAKSADEYSGIYWKKLSTQEYITEIDENNSNITNQYWNYIIEDQDWLDYNNSNPLENKTTVTEDEVNAATRMGYTPRYPSFDQTWLIPDLGLATEQVKAILYILDGNSNVEKVVRSNILLFENENEVVSTPTIESMQALTIHCEDGSYGNYLIYNEGNKLINNADSTITRTFKSYLQLADQPSYDVNGQPIDYSLKEALSITWLIPKDNTMINLDVNAVQAEWDSEKVDNYNRFMDLDTSYIADGITYYKITRYQRDDGTIYNTQDYRIDGYYSASKANNTILCSIEYKPNLFYNTSKELTFGVAGTTGTDVTLVLDFVGGKTAAIDVDNIQETFFVANLYDVNNKNITTEALNLGCQFNWQWKGVKTNGDGSTSPLLETEFLEVTTPSGCAVVNESLIQIPDEFSKNCYCRIYPIYEASNVPKLKGTEWHVLQCTVTGWGDYPLTAYLAVPLTHRVGNYTAVAIEGATSIIYNADGSPFYYRGNYGIFYSLNDEKPALDYGEIFRWGIKYPGWDKAEEEDSTLDVTPVFYPQLKMHTISQNGNILSTNAWSLYPNNFYVKGSDDNVTVYCYDSANEIIWSQPILILQNQYPSAMINNWNGELMIDEEQGTILAPRIAAGVKNKDDNTFSGVMLGSWKDKASADSNPDKQTGVYGYYHGMNSFAFKEDGTAHIGISGSGRIEFDGRNGVIRSSSWELNDAIGTRNGMCLYLDEGELLMEKSPLNNSNDKYKVTNIKISKYIEEDGSVPDLYSSLVKENNSLLNTYLSQINYYYEQYVPFILTYTEDITVSGKYDTNLDSYNLMKKKYGNACYIPAFDMPSYWRTYSNLSGMTENENNDVTKIENCSRIFVTEYNEEADEEKGLELQDLFTTAEIATDGNIVYVWTISNEEQKYINKDITDEETGEVKTISRSFYYPTKFQSFNHAFVGGTETIVEIDPETNEEITVVKEYSAEDKYLDYISNNGFECRFDNEIRSKKCVVVYFRKKANLTPIVYNTSLPKPDTDPVEYYAVVKMGDYYPVEEAPRKYFEPYLTYCTIEDLDKTGEDDIARYITLSAYQNEWPLAIGRASYESGRAFRVNWDGDVYIENGYFNGVIESEEGYIGGWIIDKNYIKDDFEQVILNSKDGSITVKRGYIGGWIVSSNSIRSDNGDKDSQITLHSKGAIEIIDGGYIHLGVEGKSDTPSCLRIGKKGFIEILDKGYVQVGKPRTIVLASSGAILTSAVLKLNGELSSITGGVIDAGYSSAGELGTRGMVLNGVLKVVNGKITPLLDENGEPTGQIGISNYDEDFNYGYFGYLNSNIGGGIGSSDDDNKSGIGVEYYHNANNTGNKSRIIATGANTGMSYVRNGNDGEATYNLYSSLQKKNGVVIGSVITNNSKFDESGRHTTLSLYAKQNEKWESIELGYWVPESNSSSNPYKYIRLDADRVEALLFCGDVSASGISADQITIGKPGQNGQGEQEGVLTLTQTRIESDFLNITKDVFSIISKSGTLDGDIEITGNLKVNKEGEINQLRVTSSVDFSGVSQENQIGIYATLA